MPWVSRLVNGSPTPQQAEIAHHLGPEARVEEVQDGVLDAADVLIDGQPVSRALIDHRAVLVRARVAHVVPRGIDEGVHRVGFAARRAAAPGTLALVERRRPGERVAAAVRHQVLRQHHRKLIVRHRHLAAARAMDERDGATPVPLPRDAPVAQPILHALSPQPALLEARCDRLHRGLELQPGELPRVHGDAVVGVLGDPGRAHVLVGAALRAHDHHDRQRVLAAQTRSRARRGPERP